MKKMEPFRQTPWPPHPPLDPLSAAMEQAAGSGDVAGVEDTLKRSDGGAEWRGLVKRGLYRAVRNDQAAVFGYLIEQGVAISDSDYEVYASYPLASGSLAIPEMLYAHGWRPSGRALCDAQSNEASLVWLIAHGARPTNELPVTNAAREGSTRAVDILLAAGAPTTQTTALHTAAQFGPVRPDGVAMMEHLVACGFDVNECDSHLLQVKNGRGTDGRRGPPLLWACSVGNVEGARWLLERGADQPLKGCSDDYWNYVMSACSNKNASELRELVSKYR